MVDNYSVTRCPHCGSEFQVSSEQLGHAGGLVRCGACQEVFNGLENLQAGGLDIPVLEPGVGDVTVVDRDEEDTLLAEREPFYRQADILINTEFRSVREVGLQVVHQFQLAQGHSQ